MDQPIGLQKLEALYCLDIHSSMTWTGYKYEIKECSGEVLYSVKEEPRPLMNLGLSFNIALLDDNGVEVIKLLREGSILGPRKVKISIEGELASIVQEKLICLKPEYEIRDANETPVYMMKGPWPHTFDFDFQLLSLDMNPLGAFSRKWFGWRKELMSNREDFTITFPLDMELKYKAACIGACVHIIEHRRQRRRRRIF